MIELILVDDNPLIRDGIKLRLRDIDDIVIIGEANNGIEALRLCEEKTPDVVLMDINMPYMDGLEATKRIKQLNKDINVLILTSYAVQDNISKAKAYECSGFIYKDTKLEDFVSVIRNVNNGYDVWSKGMLDKVSTSISELSGLNQDLESLDEKEIELIRYKVKCMKYSHIAKEMNYTESYIRQMTVKLKEKLGLSSINEIAVWGAKRGL